MEWTRGVTRVSVLTGAGISTDSGIPDFRGPDGVWTRNPRMADMFTYQNYMADPAVREQFWATYSGHSAWTAEPNAAHKAIAELDRAGLAVRVLTQNIDGLHQRGGMPDRKVLELHGSMHTTVCTKCGKSQPSQGVLARVEAGEKDPACQDCGGILKLAVVLFGQYLDPDVFSKASAIAAASQVFIAVGSTLEVHPAASLCVEAVESGAKLVIVNRDPTPYDHIAEEVIREPIGTAVPRICQALLQG
ncbi:SIR2 family NAD-dependent protein deacylase [Kibdelosporangium persicum]|uniref:SIR2 family NAD-dependent protein deacylase n=1 Tax=Kibdelosporangium persicum TaxID=2698649 RepID=UPI00156312C6|nr:Sir2 family NAD-dependent protein deacetylase [Kibdelosporangium persicum]